MLDTEATAAAIDVVLLAREIAARLTPDALLDADDAGAMFGVSSKYWREKLSQGPGCPAPVRMPSKDGRRGQPKWRRSDLLAWIEANQGRKTTRGGARRKADPLPP